MVLEPGLTVPADLKLQEGPFPPMEINLAKRFADKNVVLVGLPGAFTPT
jgi:peroxiredoxin